jgi:phage shock protein A
MALITRVARLFQADFHAVLDRIEEPEVLLRQAVREMEEELARDEQRGKLLHHELGQLTARETDLEQALERIEEELDICFGSGKDDLARTQVQRKLEAQRLHGFLYRKRSTLQETLGTLNTRLDENRSRLESMRQKAELLAAEEATTLPEENWKITPEFSIRDEDIEVAFLREQHKRNRS